MRRLVQITDENGIVHYYRWRRGLLVEIPLAWVGRTVARQHIRKRPSKTIHKRRKDSHWLSGGSRGLMSSTRWHKRGAPSIHEWSDEPR